MFQVSTADPRPTESISLTCPLLQGFTYVAPSVLEEMYKPQVVKARSPRKGIHPRHPFSPRHHLLQHQVSPAGGFGGFDASHHMMGQNNHRAVPSATAGASSAMMGQNHHLHHHNDITMSQQQEEMMDMGTPNV